MRLSKLSTLAYLLCSFWVSACDEDAQKENGSTNPSATDYTSEVPSGFNRNSWGRSQDASASGTKGAGGSMAAAVPGAVNVTGNGATPGGRIAEVKEADVYRIADSKLYLLNTYRGFMVFDITDTKKPVRISNLPIYGYPVEMFVEGTTVYVLLSEALYLKPVEGKLQFQRRNSSQIVSIDISNPAQPKLLQAYDLAGQLREGVSRKIENSLYVVSYQPSGYWWWGWGNQTGELPKEQAWIYSFDTSQPSQLTLVEKLKVFEGGQTNTNNQETGESHNRYSSGVTLTATSNAIMVVQNWYTNDYVPPKKLAGSPDAGDIDYGGCGMSKSDQESVISIVDVSDPKGNIQVATEFTTAGSLSDQFKQTYVYDSGTATGTYYGIFSRRSWSGEGCNYTSSTQNTVESWNIGGTLGTKRLSSITIGKPNETVRASTFDVDRKVVYVITAEQMDPLYAISFADRNHLNVLSAIDGLTGDMNLFRMVEGGKFLLAVGRDTGAACGGSDEKTWNNQVAVTLVDVQTLTNIRLVQRRCLNLANAGWVNSAVNWNLDQAHKMIGLSTDGQVNVLTIPISYSVENGTNDWWWYRYETAVGILSWDLSKYNPALAPVAQNVISTHGHFIHPNGEVERSILFTQNDQRRMLNISNTHLSFANIQNLNQPTLDSVVALAENVTQVFRFGDYIVEQILVNSSQGNTYEFLVKEPAADLSEAPILARFTVANLTEVMRHGNLLVINHYQTTRTTRTADYTYEQPVNQLTIYDLSKPTTPLRRGSVLIPEDYRLGFSGYGYYCGGYYGGYYFSSSRAQVNVATGIAFLSEEWTNEIKKPEQYLQDGSYIPPEYNYITKQWLTFLDLQNPQVPKLDRQPISLTSINTYARDVNLVADTIQPSGFYISFQKPIETRSKEGLSIDVVKYFAQRWERKGTVWQSEPAVSLPGSLVRVYAGTPGEKLFLTREDQYSYTKDENGNWSQHSQHAISLLRGLNQNGQTVAERLGTHSFGEANPKSMVFEGGKLYLVLGQNPYNYWYGPVGTVGGMAVSNSKVASSSTTEAVVDTSDRLLIFDTTLNQLTLLYDQSTLLTNLDLIGVKQNRLFAHLQGDGIMVLDVTVPNAPQALAFYRTLGWPSGIEFMDAKVLVPAGQYGVYQLDMNATAAF